MLPPLRFGVISAGRMAGYTMLDLMANHPATTPVAWYEIEPARPDTAARIPELIASGIRHSPSLEALLARRDLDIILNATPHYAHAETSIAALRAGHHVLCEKPPACSIGECEAMIEAAMRADRHLLIHFQHLLRPSARWLNQAICRGELGAIRRVSCLSLWFRTDDYYRRVDWAGQRHWDGRLSLDGTMVNQSIHFLHQMLALADRRGESHITGAKQLDAGLYRFHAADALQMEDTAVLVGQLDNEDRTEFCFAATTCAATSEGATRLDEYKGLVRPHRIVIEGELGRAVWDGAARLEIKGQPVQTHDIEDGPWPFYFHLQRVWAGEEPPVTPIEQATNTMRVIFDAYQAADDRIVQCPWDQHADVAGALAACIDHHCLPTQLPTPPEWA